MRHGISVPSLGEHRDRHDASDGTAKLSGLADSVHDLAEQFLIRNVFTCMRVAAFAMPATCEPEGYLAEKRKGNVRSLAGNARASFATRIDYIERDHAAAAAAAIEGSQR